MKAEQSIHAGMLFQTILVTGDNSSVKAAIAARMKHNREGSPLRDLYEDSAAQLKIAMAFLTPLANLEVSARHTHLKTALHAWMDKMSGWSPLKLAQELQIFKVSKVVNKLEGLSNYAKIPLAMGGESKELPMALLFFLESQGGLIIEGTAPLTQLQLKVRELLQ